jgi:phosphatidate cytidylyltransferase
MLRTRLVTAAILAPLIVAVVVLGEPWISLLVGVAAFLALVEVVSLLDAAGYQPPQVLAMVAGMALTSSGLVAVNADGVGAPLSGLLNALDPPGLVAAALIGGTLLLATAAFTRSDPQTGFVTWAMSTFGIIYVGLLLPAIVLVAHLAPEGGSWTTPVGVLGLRSGAAWALMLILVVWGYDTGAYLTGRLIGPSKTVEGLVGGLLLATVAAGIGAALVGLEPWHPLVIGPLVGLTAQAGDLAESMLKRAAGRKESGFLVPGHGGILDRVDTFLFAAPVLAGYALLVAGRGA